MFASLPKRVSPAACFTLLFGLAVLAWDLSGQTSCPWRLAEFGGSGACFPAGHAAAGFAFVGGYFAFRHDAPTLARHWLMLSLLAGSVLGLSQQLRGAHFMSHTLWTAWLCWCVAWAVDGLMPWLGLGRLSVDFGEAT